MEAIDFPVINLPVVSIDNGTVTLRDRDTMEQVTLKLDEVIPYIEERIKF